MSETARRSRVDFEVKFAGDESEMTFSGYGAVFGNVDAYGDVIVKGAFAETLREAKRTGRWPAMLEQHGGGIFGGGPDMTPVGIWTNMEEDDHGLKVEGKLAPTARGRDLYALLKMKPRPAIDGLSIGYIAKEWSVRTKPDEPRRTLKSVRLLEVSLVTMPANELARISSVKAAERITTIREFEDFLRDVGGFSHSAAKAIAAGGFKARPEPRDEDGTADAADELRRLLATIRS